MSQKRIFITGATGFIGQQLTQRLADEGNQVVALIRSLSRQDELQHNNVELIEGDLFSSEALDRAMQNVDEVYHLAAFAKVWAADNSFHRINVEGTENVLEAAKNAGVTKVVIASTAGAIGPAIDGPAHEETTREVDFFNDYERTKYQSEQKALEYVEQGLHIVIANLTRVYGPGLMSTSNSVTFLIDQYARGKWKVMPGDGTSNGNYVFIDDAVNGLILALDKGRSGDRYIIGGDNATYEQFFDTIAQITGKKYQLVKIPYGVLLGVGKVQLFMANSFGIAPRITSGWVRKFLYDWSVSTEKARKELGYSPRSLEDGVANTLKWLRTTNNR